jgi:hypothetical protein
LLVLEHVSNHYLLSSIEKSGTQQQKEDNKTCHQEQHPSISRSGIKFDYQNFIIKAARVVKMRSAIFSHGLTDQIAYFRACGFVLIRRPKLQSAEKIACLDTAVLSYFTALSSTYRYKFWRTFNSVSTHVNRHSIPLPYLEISGLEEILRSIAGSVQPFLSSQLHPDSSLVELSSIISLPGSLEQDIHSDTSITSPLVLSVMVALSPVTIAKGPTSLCIGSNTLACHNKYAAPSTTVYYSSDGCDSSDTGNIEFETGLSGKQSKEKQVEHIAGGGMVDGEDYLAVHAILEPGDILIFDTKVFHHGCANTSQEPRAMLCFSFQNRDVDGRDMGKAEGFTYHCHQSTINRGFTISDFSSS